MAEKTSRSDLERQLEATTDHIKRRIDALGEEAQSLQSALREAIFNNPLLSVGGALAAGLLVGWILGGRKKDPFRTSRYQQALIEEYIDAVAREARRAVAGGKEPGVAVRQALRDRVPLIVLESDGGGSAGMLRQIFDLFLRSSVGFMMGSVLERVNEDYGIDERISDALPSAAATAER